MGLPVAQISFKIGLAI